MASDNIVRTAKGVDFSPRVGSSSAIAASPSGATETVVCQITGIPTDTPVMSGVFLSGVVSLTLAGSPTAMTVRIRTGTTAGSGTVVASTGAITAGVAASALLSQDIQGFDTASTGGVSPGTSSYCLTVAVTGGSGAQTVSQTNLTALVL